jgi:hypothetical protein
MDRRYHADDGQHRGKATERGEDPFGAGGTEFCYQKLEQCAQEK